MSRLFVPLLLAVAVCLRGGPAPALERVSFATNWVAEAEHGGFYQALATGLYERRGLQVTIRQGGPQVNNAALLAAGKVDFHMGLNMFDSFNHVSNGVPILTVAAIFQKDPMALIAHPGADSGDPANFRDRRLLIAAPARRTFWPWLKARFGYTDDQIRPYTFSLAPFLADPQVVQQGFVTSEPYLIRQAGIEPVVHLLADHGYDSYSTTIEVLRGRAQAEPDLVQRFVDASIEGWVSYLYGDPAPGDALIRRENPEMTEGLLAHARTALLRHGIVDSGDALEQGIGAMREERWRGFAAFARRAGLYGDETDLMAGHTLRFVNRGAGLELKRRLLQRQ